MNLETNVLPALSGLDAECGSLIARLRLVAQAADGLRTLCAASGVSTPAAPYAGLLRFDTAPLPLTPVAAEVGVATPVPTVPTSTLEPTPPAHKASAAGEPAATSPVVALGAAPLVMMEEIKPLPITKAVDVEVNKPLSQTAPKDVIIAHRVNGAPAAAGVTSDPKEEGLTALELREQLSAWSPKIQTGVLSLKDIYQQFRSRCCRYSRDLPPTMDLSNANVVSALSNHLRHEWCPGYANFCHKLSKFTGLGHLYKMTRDKAEAAVHAAFPELAQAKASAPAPQRNFGETSPSSVTGR